MEECLRASHMLRKLGRAQTFLRGVLQGRTVQLDDVEKYGRLSNALAVAVSDRLVSISSGRSPV